MSIVWSLFLLCLIYYVGQVINKLSRGRFQTMLFVVVVFLIGFSTKILPSNIVETAYIPQLYAIFSPLILVNMGTTLRLEKVKRYWRVALTAVFGLIGMAILLFTIGRAVAGNEISLATFPTLTGGIYATLLMSDALDAAGMGVIVSYVVLIHNMQTWVGIPAIGFGVRMEGKEQLKKIRSGEISLEALESHETTLAATETKHKLIKRLPQKFDTPFVHLAILAAVSGVAITIATYTSPVTKGLLGNSVIALLLGWIAKSSGIIVENPVKKAGLMDVMMFTIVFNVFGKLSGLSFAGLVQYFPTLIFLVLTASAGMAISSLISYKLLKLPRGIAFATSFSCFIGYPLNYQVTLDSIEAITETEEERAYLEREITDQIVVGGIVVITILSILITSVVLYAWLGV